MIDDAFVALAAGIRTRVDAFQGAASKKALEHLHVSYRHAGASLDYDALAEPFAHAYLLRNFWKAAAALSREQPPLALRVLDLGSGSGAATLAALGYIDARLRAHAGVHVTLVDRSAEQLSLATRLLDEAEPLLKYARVERKLVHADVKTWCPTSDSDLTLLSHMVTENPGETTELLEKAIAATGADGRVYIIERADDPVWSGVVEGLPRTRPWRRAAVTFRQPIASGESPGDRVDYVVVRVPEHPQLPKLVELYFEAWRLQDPQLLDHVFTDDVVYVEKPWQRPVKGLDDVKGYWRDEVIPQRQPRVVVASTAYAGDEAFVEWSANFSVNDEDTAVRGILVLRYDRDRRRIDRLHEYFRTRRDAPAQTKSS